jgi:hypothetical protein
MKSLLVSLLSLLLSLIANSASAEDMIDAPQKVGDMCGWNVINHLGGKPGEQTRTVSKVEGDTITFLVSPENGSSPSETIIKLNGDVVSLNEIVATPFQPISFTPTTVGTTWERDYTFNYGGGSSNTVTAQYKGSVVGTEQITVPAGTFNAFKIKYSISYRYVGDLNGRSGNIIVELWYAPKTGCIAKASSMAYRGRGGSNLMRDGSIDFVLNRYAKF